MAKTSKEKMKLVFVLPQYDPQTSDTYERYFSLAKLLAQKDSVFLFIEKARKNPSKGKFVGTYSQKIKLIPFNLLERLLVFIILRLRGFDRFFIRYSYASAILTGLLVRIFGGKTFYWHCEEALDFPKKFNWDLGGFKLRFLHEVPQILAIKLSTVLITATNGLKKYYQKKFNKKNIKVVPNWVDLTLFKRDKKQESLVKAPQAVNKKIVLFVHWLSKRKGADFLPDIIIQTLKRYKKTFFIIIGAGPLFFWLQRELIRRKLKDNILLTGPISYKQLVKYYNASDVFLLPSRQEGIPPVMLEAMACGVPIVGFNVGGVKEIVGIKQKKYFVEKNKVSKLIQALAQQLKSRKIRLKLTQENLQMINQYKLETIAKQFLKVFNE